VNLSSIYPGIKTAITAFIPAYSHLDRFTGRQLPPPILGTGFFINSHGLLVTNAHVADTFQNFASSSNVHKKIKGIIFQHSKGRVKKIILNIKNIIRIDDTYNTSKKPDIAFVETDLDNSSFLELMSEETELIEGMEIATSGFPTGRNSLLGPEGYIQISPTLQRGIISAILPYPKKEPDAFSVNIMTHGGASGSPVFFTDTGKVAGILFSVLTDLSFSSDNNIQATPTSISYAIPAHQIKKALKKIDL